MLSQPADAWGERLPRHLGLWSAIAVLVGSTIGSGIFRVPASVAGRLQEPGPVMVAWVVGGVIALFGALTLAELAAALPRSGGVFAYLLEGFGPLPAFLFGWSELTVIRASALGAIATIFAETCRASAILPGACRPGISWSRRHFRTTAEFRCRCIAA
jgi:amino acid transporter